ncbi:ABC transporter permease [Virgisporangium ochraceum]|uniref:Polyamine ABC transporter permease n=1 Tax=Virgisporangium ochraceum TaxID=65505 RepID=A0A8J4A0T7_9ACTN|nr:ABC transporter permease [Virgisporangium ochraceum]GIJ73759.1 polyamine ABC transporter permease [Virgisporangium ochraceum]
MTTAPLTPLSAPPSPSTRGRRRGRARDGLWAALATPGTLWLVALLVVPFYSIAAVAFGYRDPLFGSPVPEWNPTYWDTTTFLDAVRSTFVGDLRPVFVRTLVFVGVALLICVAIGYPIAYYLARHAGRYRGLLLGLILAPWWINYLTRMLAWLSLLQDDGYVNDVLTFLHLPAVQWLSGRPYTVILALVYGYIPFFIVPLYATLDRIDGRLLDASRDLGVGGVRTFLHVTLPLSRPGLLTACVVTALPMFGDYYTNTLVSGSPRTTMVGNQIELYLLGGSRQDMGASLVLIMSAMLMVLMAYYLISSQRAERT